MRCPKCGTEIDQHVFPGGTVRCARCGTTAVMDASGQPLSGSPYREPATAQAYSPWSNPLVPHDELAPLCPRCTRALEQTDHSDLLCDKCHGVFVKHAELAARIDSARPSQPSSEGPRHASSRPPESTVQYGRCPECSDVMTRMNFGRHSGIVVDACRSHGTWFDQGELDAVLEFVRAGGLEAEEVARRELALSPDDRLVIRAVEAELSAEAMKEQRSIERAAQVADDLLYVLFGVSTRSVQRIQ